MESPSVSLFIIFHCCVMRIFTTSHSLVSKPTIRFIIIHLMVQSRPLILTMSHPSKCEPSVYPSPSFDPKKDAEALHAASKGSQFIEIICHRSNIQRLEIAKAYKTLFGEELIERLKKKTSGQFEKLLVALTTPLPEFYAKELHDAMAGKESVLIETLTTLRNFGIQAVSKCYRELFGKTLEHDIKGDTSGDFKKLCIALVQGNRDEGKSVEAKAAKEDAQKLFDAGVARWGTDESVFNLILVSRSYEHLEQVFLEYHAIAGHTIEEAISKEFSGSIKQGHLAIIKCVRNKSAYFAERLYKSMKGLGTDDKTLIRIVVARSEIDLATIRGVFKDKYGDTLGNWIHGDTSGDYREALLAIAGRS